MEAAIFFVDVSLSIRWPKGQQKLLNEKLRIEYKMTFLNKYINNLLNTHRFLLNTKGIIEYK